MFVGHPFTGYPVIVPFVCFGQRKFLAPFLRQLTIAMHFLDTDVAGIDLTFRGCPEMHSGLFEQPKVVTLAIGKVGANNPFGFLIYDYLAFERVSFLFAGVVFPLSFFGRSIGDSEASTRTTPYSTSLLSNSLRPGNAKRLS